MIRRILKSEGFTIFLILLGLVLVIVSLTACGAPSKGTVTEKDYDPAFSYWQAGYTSCSGSGTSYRCTTTPGYMVYLPENYALLIADYEVEGWVEVSQRTYDSTNIGDYYDNGAITAGH